MLNVVKEQKGDVLVVRFTGSIDESSDFEALIGTPPNELHVNCRNVPRINSEGIRSWVQYFQALQEKGVTVKFQECSTAIVEQLNLISNFSCGGEVESIFVPFSCKNCKGELVGLFETDVLEAKQFRLPSLKCTKCGGDVQFDDLQEEYFSFITRRKNP